MDLVVDFLVHVLGYKVGAWFLRSVTLGRFRILENRVNVYFVALVGFVVVGLPIVLVILLLKAILGA